jgi:HD-GYP domain-containing protein (c-di-GMP phosphodiesterase class II)
MGKLSVVIGTAMGLPDTELDDLKLLAMVHDVGKVAINSSILNKPDKLSKEEWEEMKLHSEIGYRIALASPELSQIADYILCHHEKWDGSGYPMGKKGIQIPKLSRIISVIDAYDVMTHVRSYKTAMSSRAALEELSRCSGTQFDPDIVDIFVKLLRNYNEIE